MLLLASSKCAVAALAAIASAPFSIDDSLGDLVARATPSVVTILTYEAGEEATGQGTGFFISDSLLVTNYHVVSGKLRASAVLGDGREIPIGGYVAFGEKEDLAILKVDTPLGSPLTVTRDQPRVGDEIIVIGSPLGLRNTVSQGIVAALRTLDDQPLLQISAPISPGSSGSPVFDSQGRVVGVATSALVDGQSLNFAVPSLTLLGLERSETRPLPILALDTYEGSELPSLERAKFLLLTRKSPLEAIPVLEALTDKEPLNAWCWLYLAQALSEHQTDLYTPVFASRWDTRHGIYTLVDGLEGLSGADGRANDALGQRVSNAWITAHTIFSARLEANADNHEDWIGLGLLYFMAGSQESENAFRRSLAVNPSSREGRYHLARCLLAVVDDKEGVRKREEAMQLLTELASSPDAEARSLVLLCFAYEGQVHSNLEDSKLVTQGVISWKEAQERAAAKEAARTARNSALAQRGVSLSPDFVEAWCALARTAATPELQDAAYAQAIQISPNHLDTYHEWSDHLAEQGRLNEAAAVLEAARERVPSNIKTSYDLACTYSSAGQKDKAFAIYRCIAQTNPGVAQRLLGIITSPEPINPVEALRKQLEEIENEFKNPGPQR